MSHFYYQELWKEVQSELQKNIAEDFKLGKKGPLKETAAVKWLIGHLYMNYVRIANKLDECYDQMIHPQKREVVGRLLDLSLGRLLELKAEIVRIEYDDYCFFDDILIELKLTHNDMEIHVPKYFSRNLEKVKLQRKELMRLTLEEIERENFREAYLKNVPEEEKEEVWAEYLAQEEQKRLEREKFEEQQRKAQGPQNTNRDSVDELKKELHTKQIHGKKTDRESVIEAISLIQRHERARQGRNKAGEKKRSRNVRIEKIGEREGNEAAKKIQRHWRRYRQRVRESKKNEKLYELLGLIEPSYTDPSTFEKLNVVTRLRRKLQEINEKEYEDALIAMKNIVDAWYYIPIEEDTVDEIRGWFQWFFDKTNFLPDYPPEKPIFPTGEIMGVPKKLGPNFAAKAFPERKIKEEESFPKSALWTALAGMTPIGGSALVVGGHWIEPQEFLVCQKELDKRKKAGEKDKKSKEDKQKAKEQEKKKLLQQDTSEFKIKESNFLVPLKKADKDYRLVWSNLDESKNYDQKFIRQFIKDDACWKLSMEVRKAVDEMMVAELEILKEALERDKHPKRRRRKKKIKKKKGKKKKKEKKDPTGNRTTDDLFMELFKNGIIKDYEEVYLKEYLGERSFAAYELRQRNIDWPPSSGDVRELILQQCILPLGSTRIHQLAPLLKSICLTGPENSAKEFLARVICTETSAVMFDLTPSNVVGKYPGKDGLKMLQHLIEKMSRVLQPSVIFVDGAEKHFYKKVPKEEKDTEPRRLTKMLKKIVKGIKPIDQVLLLGVSSRPWLAKRRQFLRTYQKILMVPPMDYGSYERVWRILLKPYHSIPSAFDVSCLAKVSEGFSVKAIADAVKTVMNVERVAKCRFKPFKPEEFLEELLKSKPFDLKIRNKFLKFYQQTELGKKRKSKMEEGGPRNL